MTKLDADLENYVVIDPSDGTRMLDHPLVRFLDLDAPCTEGYDLIARINATYAAKKEDLRKAIETHNWSSYVFLHERPYRCQALLELLKYNIEPPEFCHVLGEVWQDTEYPGHQIDLWRTLWTIAYADREYAMNEQERAAFSKLPEEMVIWRGARRSHAIQGLSWTLDREKALWFAHRFGFVEGSVPRLVRGIVHKADVLAYFNGRKESEIVVLPENVRGLTVLKLKRKSPETT